MEANIKLTILSKLFLKPNPTCNKREFNQLLDFIFPIKQDFINFLKEKNYELVEQYAQKILLALSYNTFAAPPSRLLINIHNMEAGTPNENYDDFISRDHFVHLVHLYLFGIYIYFYHTTLNSSINYHYKYIRHRNYISHDITLLTVRDFIISWRYFVLYHDIGYPIEKFTSEKRGIKTSDKKRFTYTEPINHIAKSLNKDILMRGLSKLIMIYQNSVFDKNNSFENTVINYLIEEGDLIDDMTDKQVEDLLNDSFNKRKKNAIISSWISNNVNVYNSPESEKNNLEFITKYYIGFKDSSLIRKLYSYKDIEQIINVIDYKNIVIVVKDKLTEIPVTICIPLNDSDLANSTWRYIYLIPKKVLGQNALVNIFNSYQSDNIFAKSIFENSNYISEYYVVSKISIYDNFLNEILTSNKTEHKSSDEINKIDFKKIADHIVDECPFKIDMIKDKNGLERYSFELYITLYEFLGYLGEDKDDIKMQAYFNNLKKVVEPLVKDLPEKAGIYLKEFLEKNIDKENLIDDIRSKPISKILHKTLERGKIKTILKLCNYIESKLSNDNKKLYDRISDIAVFKRDLLEALNKFLPDITDIKYEVDSNTFNYKDFYDKTFLEKNKLIFQLLSKKLKNNNFSSINEIQNYIPEYVNPKEIDQKFVDHGFASAILFSRIIEHLDESFLAAKENKTINNFLTLGLGLNLNSMRKNYLNRYHLLLADVLFAVLVHNLYPKELKNKNFRTDLDKDPLAFLAILADSLQPWDRKFSVNQAITKLPYGTYSTNFNIIVEGSTLKIVENDKRMDLIKRFKTLKTDLEKYLIMKNVIIELSLSNWS
jgi:hypothetical protein